MNVAKKSTSGYKKVKLDLGDSDNENEAKLGKNDKFHQEKYEGVEGHMLLQMQKGYRGDNRFKIDDRFIGDYESKVFRISSHHNIYIHKHTENTTFTTKLKVDSNFTFY